EYIDLTYMVRDGLHGIVTVNFDAPSVSDSFHPFIKFIGDTHIYTMGIVCGGGKNFVGFRKTKTPGIIAGMSHFFEIAIIPVKAVNALAKFKILTSYISPETRIPNNAPDVIIH